MMTAIDLANAEQRAASDPSLSAFVAASAGSGKTKLLTDRLLRLMLAGTPPGRILCLTYTKAAAAEMAIRLNRRLGEWVALPQPELDAKLRDIGVQPGAESRDRARKLFADVLDLPGGIRIATIHAFCQSLLRRFPLEAGLSPHFELADDNDAAARLREAREFVLADSKQHDAIIALAAETNEQDFAELTAKFSNAQQDFLQLLQEFSANSITAMTQAVLGVTQPDEANILARAVRWPAEQDVRAAMLRISVDGPAKAAQSALIRLDWLASSAASRARNWGDWAGSFFGLKDRYALKTVVGETLLRAAPELGFMIEAEQIRIEMIEEALKAARLAALNAHLLQVMAPILQKDHGEKAANAALSYGDLISRTGKLLIDPGAAWILYKLDGGIDHLLLDEVQDTAPAQWEIADAIATEFFAGEGARDAKRSIFAVGDAKQSIFSFQGADLKSFETYRTKFRRKVIDAGETWLDGSLSVSFRSTAPVLALADAVFAAGPSQTGVTAPGEVLTHGVTRLGQAGRVSLWPLTQPADPPAAPAWAVPDEYQSAESSKAVLARQIADFIKARLDNAEVLPSRGRIVTPGDFLILVRRRDSLVTAITAACKGRKIPIAGLDRMVLTEQQAVSDLLALCDALLLPDDDLAFGQYLTSPLGGLSDESLMALALGRKSNLAAALFARRAEREDWAAAQQFFEVLRNKTDFTTPHALLAEALGPLGGRAKILRRLGAEAAEPIDELLSEALAYAKREPGSLQNFVYHLRQSGASIKREAESGGDVVRIMTVHGAKGLQAPIVILPDSTAMPQSTEKLFWLNPPQQPDVAVPIFCPRTALRPQVITDAAAAQKAASLAEYNRLLYVALTRAEDEVVVAGAAAKRALDPACWYESLKAGFMRLAHETQPDGRLVFATPQMAAPDRAETRRTVRAAVLPAWAGGAPLWQAAPPRQETTRPEPLAPSRSAEETGKTAIAASPLGADLAAARETREAALAKGRAVHALLQHLPDLARDERAAAARRYLRQIAALDEPAREAIIGSVLAVLADPALGELFGPGSRAEVPLAGVVGDVEIGGLVDRLAVTSARVWLADYKTDRQPPASVEVIPAAYLAQLAAYKAIVAQIFPDRAISCLLIFTQNASVLAVPPEMLARYVPA